MLRSNSKSLGNFTLYFSGRGCKSLRDWAQLSIAVLGIGVARPQQQVN